MATTAVKSNLDLSVVEPADIILCTSSASTSRAIRVGTCSTYSHAILALYNGECIEATPDRGVRKRSLMSALDNASYATLYRHKLMTAGDAGFVCAAAKVQRGKKYDHFGAARSGVSTGCGGALRLTKTGLMVELVHEITQHGKHDDTFYCSELIAYAFEKANIPLLDTPSHRISPGKIAKSSKLTRIKDLISA